jgi:beta-galactosidase
MNGANLELTGYRTDITSYDYACPLDEAGDPSPRYFAFREVLKKYVDLPDVTAPAPGRKAGYGTVALTEAAGLFESLDVLGRKRESLTPDPMEAFDQDYGFILYRTRLSGPRPEALLYAHEVRDRALVFVDGRQVAVFERETGEEMCSLAIPPGGVTLELLVENMGRVNYGPGLMDRKGIAGGVTFDWQFQIGWEVHPLPLNDLTKLTYKKAPVECPAFFRGSFEVGEPADTFLALPGWTKGLAWINGICLGRYWQRGPQQSLYVPAPFLRQGKNELVVLELHGCQQAVVELIDHRD